MKTSPDDPVIFNGKNTEFNGLTKRELFAAIAMMGICADPEEMEDEQEEGESCEECCCRKAVMHADCLIEALNK